MKVMFLANTGWYLSNFRANTISSFALNSHQIVCAYPRAHEDIRLAQPGVRLRKFPMDNTGTNPIFELGSLVGILRIILIERPDVVFSFNPKTNLYGMLICKIFRIKCIPNVSGVGSASELSGWKGCIVRCLMRFCFRSAFHVFFQNSSDKGLYQDSGYILAEKSEVIPGSGVDLDRFQMKNNTERPTIRFLMACRLIEQKGVLEYLEAAEVIKKKGYNCEFLLAGIFDKSKRSVPRELIDYSHDNGFVEFLGNVAEMDVLLDEVDCVVLPSWYPEGVPRFLLEGLASGKVIITTNTPGCSETLIEGENGFFSEARSSNSLAESFERVLLLDNQRISKMKALSRRLAEEKFDERIVIERYLEMAGKAYLSKL